VRTLLQDIVFALRLFRKNPSLTAIAAISLALGIGANTAMFSFTDAIMFRPLPVAKPDELVRVFTNTKGDNFDDFSYPEYAAFRDRTKTLSGVVAASNARFSLTTPGRDISELLGGMIASGNLFSVLGVDPVLGRAFRPDEDRVPGADAVAVISHRLWERRFDSSRDVIGKTIKLDGRDFSIVGVAPASFTGLDLYYHPDVYVPLMMAREMSPGDAKNPLEDRSNRWLRLFGVRKPGVSWQAVSAEAAVFGRQFAAAHPDTDRNRSAFALPEIEARKQMDTEDSSISYILLTIVSLVLLIACANVANLLLARAAGRSKEIAVRLAIGASRLRLVRQFLTESVLLALFGGALGLLFANWCVNALGSIKLPTDMPVSLTARLDTRVLLFSLIVSLATGIIFGLAPSLQSTRADLVPALKGSESQAGTGRRRFALRNLLVVAQVSISLVLLIAAALSVKSFLYAEGSNPGFRGDHVLLMSFDPTLLRYTESQTKTFYKQLLDKTRSTPGVISASLAEMVPMAPDISGKSLYVEGYALPPDQNSISMIGSAVGTDYFATMRIPILRGRAFDNRDTAGSPKVVIVNQTMAAKYWPHGNPLGRRVRLNDRNGPEAQVIGVAKDGKYLYLAESHRPFVYVPYSQDYHASMILHVLTKGDPANLAGPIRAEVHSLDPDLPAFDVRTLHDFLDAKALLPQRLSAQMIGGIGLIGMLMAVVGLYGVVAYAVSRRTREIGIRMAIGAGKRDVLNMILAQGMGLTLIGVGIGLALAFAVTRLMGPLLLFGVNPADPLVFALIPAILISVTIAACWLPARRAAKVDPMVALRYE